jgi:hypothetical protein
MMLSNCWMMYFIQKGEIMIFSNIVEDTAFSSMSNGINIAPSHIVDPLNGENLMTTNIIYM